MFHVRQENLPVGSSHESCRSVTRGQALKRRISRTKNLLKLLRNLVLASNQEVLVFDVRQPLDLMRQRK